MAECLRLNLLALVKQYGFEKIGFLTLTTAGGPVWEEYQRRLHSLQTHAFKELFQAWMLVFEFHEDGRIHCHAVVACRVDIRTGFKFKRYLKSRERGRSITEKRQLIRQAAANDPNLRKLWAVLRGRLPGFGFGRHELIPIRTTADAIAWYVGGYIRKSLEGREAQFKGKRFVRYSRGWRCASVHFAWNTPGAWLWRKKVAALAQALGVETLEEMKHACGRHWAHHLRDKITAINDLEEYPTFMHARKDGWVNAGTYGDFLYAIEVGGQTELVESGRMPTDTVLLKAQELARALVQARESLCRGLVESQRMEPRPIHLRSRETGAGKVKETGAAAAPVSLPRRYAAASSRTWAMGVAGNGLARGKDVVYRRVK